MKRGLSYATACVFWFSTLSGCATGSKDIAATYVSPMQYQSYDCSQIVAESNRINARVAQIGGRLDEAAANDKAITGIGVVLFWPALFALGGTKQQEAEYAKLRGEADAVQIAAIEKKCVTAPPSTPSAGEAQKDAPASQGKS